MNELQRFGARVRAARERKGWSQEQLAAQAGKQRSYIGAVERGELNVTLRNILRLARALGVQPGELLNDVDEI